jgi:hypothetical protein
MQRKRRTVGSETRESNEKDESRKRQMVRAGASNQQETNGRRAFVPILGSGDQPTPQMVSSSRKKLEYDGGP